MPNKELKDVPKGKAGKGLRALSPEVRNNMGFKMDPKVAYMTKVTGDPAMSMKHVEDNAMPLDPAGFYKDFKVPTPGYLKAAGYGYNPDQTYTFRYSQGDNTDPRKDLRTETPLSDEEYKAGGYTLKSASYKPISNPDAAKFQDSEGFNKLKPVTPHMPKSGDSQVDANKKDNPYISQFTQFINKGDGNVAQSSTKNTVSRTYAVDYSTFNPINYKEPKDTYKTYDQRGATSEFYTTPDASGSNDLTTLRFRNNDGLRKNFGSFRFYNQYDKPYTSSGIRPFRTATFKGVGASANPTNPNFYTSALAGKLKGSKSGDQQSFARAIGPGMSSILSNVKYTSPTSGESKNIFPNLSGFFGNKKK